MFPFLSSLIIILDSVQNATLRTYVQNIQPQGNKTDFFPLFYPTSVKTAQLSLRRLSNLSLSYYFVHTHYALFVAASLSPPIISKMQK